MSEKVEPPLLDTIHDIGDGVWKATAFARLMILALLYVVESGDFTFLMRQTGLT